VLVVLNFAEAMSLEMRLMALKTSELSKALAVVETKFSGAPLISCVVTIPRRDGIDRSFLILGDALLSKPIYLTFFLDHGSK
jgi:hypothetical protein